MQDISDFNGVTLDTDQTITGQKTFSKTILGQADIIAYSTGISKELFPIASKTAIGCVKIGDNINVSGDGTISVNIDGGEAGSVDWDNINNKPSSFTPSTHTHDDRYYTETEINTKLNSKSNTDHTHSNYASTITTTGTGNAVTSISQSGNTITVTKGATSKPNFFANDWSESQLFCFFAPSIQMPDLPFSLASAIQYSINAFPYPFPRGLPRTHKQYR